MRTVRLIAAFALVLAVASPALAASATVSARTAYERAVARQRALDGQAASPAPRAVRRLVSQYEAIAREHPRSGYADNALWNAAELSASLWERTRLESDRRTAVRLLDRLISSYPTSSLLGEARPRLREVSRKTPPKRRDSTSASATARRPADRPAGATAAAPARKPATASRGVLAPDPPVAVRDLPAAALPGAKAPSRVTDGPLARIVDIRRHVLPDLVRVTIELDGEVPFREERLDNPARLFFDLKDTGASPRFQDGALSFPDDVVRQVRFGGRSPNATRIAVDLDGIQRYSVFTLYNPFRIVVDFERAPSPGGRIAMPAVTSVPPPVGPAPVPASPIAVGPLAPPSARPVQVDASLKLRPGRSNPPLRAASPTPAASRPVATSGTEAAHTASAADDAALAPGAPGGGAAAPAPPAANASGTFSMARQLGLGVSRIVIDPGHGGHDPGARGTRLWEAELVLDIALRLERLLLQQPGLEVVLTRRTDAFVALEERTAIANRERADLFLSIHANASRNRRARGVETYFLNFASNPEAEAVAARENSASGRTMRNLTDMVKAITLNNKLDESRDFAAMVQRALAKRLQGHDPGAKDLGVKQAPFVVLIGAQMPSVLAEISFVTHPEEGALLRTHAYRQSIAEALFEAVVKYQRSLKSVGTVAEQ
jgi:N-acetylmuramoyl-L-alanine amidase